MTSFPFAFITIIVFLFSGQLCSRRSRHRRQERSVPSGSFLQVQGSHCRSVGPVLVQGETSPPLLFVTFCTISGSWCHSYVIFHCFLVFLQNFFLLSSSMDKTVRLWHISRRECLCCFQHIDFVTAIAFHPRVSRRARLLLLISAKLRRLFILTPHSSVFIVTLYSGSSGRQVLFERLS